MGVTSLVRRALHPGTSLKHDAERLTPVDALHALARTSVTGSTLIHARQGQDNMPQLKAVVFQIAMEIFAHRNWQVQDRGRFSRHATFDAFVEQVWREYMGEPCKRCKGHGVVGRKFDQVRHRLADCEACGSRGYVMVLTKSWSVKERKPLIMRKPCPMCRGKMLIEIKQELKAGRLHSCPACAGGGAAPASVRVRAKALHYGHSQVHTVWTERFRAVLAALRSHEFWAMMECQEYLYGDGLDK
mgnify:CR=1 FL=1